MAQSLQERFNSPDSYVSMALGLAVVLMIGIMAINYVNKKDTSSGNPASQEATGSTMGNSLSAPAAHLVKKGETLWSISEAYYKTGYNWVDIQKANKLTNADAIEEGATLTIPVVTPIYAAGTISATSTEAPKHQNYTVTHGDDLWKIAVKEYNNGYRWVDIARANKLSNPDLIHAGNILTLPQ